MHHQPALPCLQRRSRFVFAWFSLFLFFFQAEDGIRDHCVTGVQTCALPISGRQAILPWLSAIVLAARANGLAVLDGTFNLLNDWEGFHAECEQGRDLGMDRSEERRVGKEWRSRWAA